MGRPVNSKVKREETVALHMEVNKYAFRKFRDSLAKYGYPMNVMLEIFMRQYVLGKILLDEENVLFFREYVGEKELLRTTVNREVRDRYFTFCRENGMPTRIPIIVFMQEYSEGKFVPELRKVAEN
ncbi:MAG: hypothetical protein IJO61_05490 [Oscillospiraceae bacterium]|nr:hypothetical protein [Oscillospiraceae bacterium]